MRVASSPAQQNFFLTPVASEVDASGVNVESESRLHAAPVAARDSDGDVVMNVLSEDDMVDDYEAKWGTQTD